MHKSYDILDMYYALKKIQSGKILEALYIMTIEKEVELLDAEVLSRNVDLGKEI